MFMVDGIVIKIDKIILAYYASSGVQTSQLI